MDFFDKHKEIILFIIFTLFCFISLSVKNSGFTGGIEGAGSFVVSPFQKMYNAIQTNISLLWNGFSELQNAREELKKTRKRLEKFESIAEELDEIKHENNMLRKLLQLKEREKFDSVPASIISKDPDNWFRTLIINRGSDDGITVNMPVIAYFGDKKAVVGKIVETRGSLSRILPIISNDLKIGVIFRDKRFPGLLTGYSTISKLCIVDYVDKTADIKPGDVLVTSGDGGIFPRGILVGVALKSFPSESGSFQRVIIRPYINFDLVENVIVIKKQPDYELINFLKSGNEQ